MRENWGRGRRVELLLWSWDSKDSFDNPSSDIINIVSTYIYVIIIIHSILHNPLTCCILTIVSLVWRTALSPRDTCSTGISSAVCGSRLRPLSGGFEKTNPGEVGQPWRCRTETRCPHPLCSGKWSWVRCRRWWESELLIVYRGSWVVGGCQGRGVS